MVVHVNGMVPYFGKLSFFFLVESKMRGAIPLSHVNGKFEATE